jgi:hypothetical protein
VLSASVPPLVKNISPGLALMIFATVFDAFVLCLMAW